MDMLPADVPNFSAPSASDSILLVPLEDSQIDRFIAQPAFEVSAPFRLLEHATDGEHFRAILDECLDDVGVNNVTCIGALLTVTNGYKEAYPCEPPPLLNERHCHRLAFSV